MTSEIRRELDGFLHSHLGRRLFLERWLLGTSSVVVGSIPGSLALASSSEKVEAPRDSARDRADSSATAPTAGEPAATGRLVSGRAWDDYCEVIREAGHIIERFGNEPSDQERAEWYRYITRLMRNSLERLVENCEPERPRLRDIPWRTSMNVQNPDQDHIMTEFVDGSHEYRITGNRGTTPYFVIAAWSAQQPVDIGSRDWAPKGIAGLAEFDPSTFHTHDFLTSNDMQFKEDGSFEVILSQRKREGNWLRLQQNTVGLLIRVVHHYRTREISPTWDIKRLDDPKPRPTQPADMSYNLAKAAQFVLGYGEQTRSWWQDNLGKRPNRLRFSLKTYLSNGGVADRQFAFGAWHKEPDEALVLEFTPPECEYWIFQLCNRWEENLDNYEDGQGYVTKFTAKPDDKGLVRLIISDQPMTMAGNWIDAFGHNDGVMGLRLIQTKGVPEVLLYRVKSADLQAMGFKALDRKHAVITGDKTD